MNFFPGKQVPGRLLFYSCGASAPRTAVQSRASTTASSVSPSAGTIPYTTLQPIASAIRDIDFSATVLLGSLAARAITSPAPPR